ncbi:MAG: hypothetical protein L0K43_05715 [Bifidobacterium crudilactis]|nr:hypothetical protein [Bifidobacterium crudilactis]
MSSGGGFVPKWVNLSEASLMLGMDRRQILKLGREGVLRVCQPSRQYRVSTDSIEHLDERLTEVRSTTRIHRRRRS